jgi:hypothetical protein
MGARWKLGGGEDTGARRSMDAGRYRERLLARLGRSPNERNGRRHLSDPTSGQILTLCARRWSILSRSSWKMAHERP